MEDYTYACARALGAGIRNLRKARGLSQEDFSEWCDLDRTYIGEVERGEKNVSLESILRICAALQIAPSQLFHSAGY